MVEAHVERFVQESGDQIAELNEALVSFEGDPADEDAMERIFRTAHTLKGNCGAMGYDAASDLAHAIEDLLESIRAGRVAVTPELMDAVFAGVDELEAMIEEVAEHGEVHSDPGGVVEELREHAAAPGLTAPTDDEVASVVAQVAEPTHAGHRVYHVRLEVAGDPSTHGRALVDALEDAFDLLGTDPDRATIDAGDYDGTFDAVFTSVVERDAVERALDPVDAVDTHLVTDATDRLDLAPADVGDEPAAGSGDGVGDHAESGPQDAAASGSQASADDVRSSVEAAGADEAADADDGGDAGEAADNDQRVDADEADDADDRSVEELLEDDDVARFDDLDELAEEVEGDVDLDDIGDAGTFDDVGLSADDVTLPGETDAGSEPDAGSDDAGDAHDTGAAPTDDVAPAGAADAAPSDVAEGTEPTAADDGASAADASAVDGRDEATDDEIQDATAEFQQLKEEVDPVGFDELQSEIEELEFDEYDSDDEVGFDELLSDDELDDDFDPGGTADAAADAADAELDSAGDGPLEDRSAAPASAPDSESTATRAEEPSAVADDPVGDVTEPAGDVTEPVGDVTEPVGDDAEPVGEDAEPVGDDAEPSGAVDDSAVDAGEPTEAPSAGAEASPDAEEGMQVAADQGDLDDGASEEDDGSGTESAAGASDPGPDATAADLFGGDQVDLETGSADAEDDGEADDGAPSTADEGTPTTTDDGASPTVDESAAAAVGEDDPAPAEASVQTEADEEAPPSPEETGPTPAEGPPEDDSFGDVVAGDVDGPPSTADDEAADVGERNSVLNLDGDATPAGPVDASDSADTPDSDGFDPAESDSGDAEPAPMAPDEAPEAPEAAELEADAPDGDAEAGEFDLDDADGGEDFDFAAEPIEAGDDAFGSDDEDLAAEGTTFGTEADDGDEDADADEGTLGTVESTPDADEDGLDAAESTPDADEDGLDAVEDAPDADEDALDAVEDVLQGDAGADVEPSNLEVEEVDFDGDDESASEFDDGAASATNSVLGTAGSDDAAGIGGEPGLGALGGDDDGDAPSAAAGPTGPVTRGDVGDSAGAFGEPVVEGPDEDRRERIGRLGVPDRGADGDGDAGASQSIRVDVEQLDGMLNLVEGLVTSRARLRRALEEGEPRPVIEDELDDLEDVTAELQDSVMDVRLVPLRNAVTKLPRTVRDVAREQDKDVDFELHGQDVELDRSIVDEIGDPLVHLVRNAVDHGIEPPEERADAGKPQEGSIELRARRERDRVYVTVEDDGRGIDPDDLRDAAVEDGDYDREAVEAMADEEVYDLLFESGFTTAEEVTDVSGRGVGMDVVADTVSELDGSVSVDSEPGEGTTVTLELPVRLAISDVLFLRVGDEEYGVPVAAVDEVGPVTGLETGARREALVGDGSGDDVDATEGSAGDAADDAASADETEQAEDEQTDGEESDESEREVIRLRDALDVGGERAGSGMLVHLRDDVRDGALLCDTVRGQQEVVVKPFQGVLDAVPGIEGATVLGDGDVVAILNPETL